MGTTHWSINMLKYNTYFNRVYQCCGPVLWASLAT